MTTRKSRSKQGTQVDWEARAKQARKQIKSTLAEGEKAAEALWHQSAVAALHWVGSHRSRVAAFRKSVKGTPVERVVTAALKAVRTEARSPASRSRTRARTKSSAPRRKRG